ncbi:nodulation protein NolU [Bradyrhizobium sp. Pa8]|uniref:nodulation protein NolU n=1 Tax=Bradyrhizobium sp. Pa8 TaxID=3386552 RepID=UPI00403F80D4
MVRPDPSAERHRPLNFPSIGVRELAASIHPTRLAARLDANLSAATLVRLQKSPRLQIRLPSLLLDHEMDSKRNDFGPDLLHGRDPKRAALLAGGIWHARSLTRLISKHDVAVLIGRIGIEVQAFGIRHAAHAVSTSVIADPQQLAQEIEDHGHGCLGAWLDEASAFDRRRVLLRLAIGTAADNPAAEHRDAAGRLFSLVLPQLATEAPAA